MLKNSVKKEFILKSLKSKTKSVIISEMSIPEQYKKLTRIVNVVTPKMSSITKSQVTVI